MQHVSPAGTARRRLETALRKVAAGFRSYMDARRKCP
jgi:hypothetical protein